MPITLRNTTDAGVPTPASDKVTLFTENDILYIKDDTGATFPVGSGGSGTVTSVDITGNNGLTVSGSPITTSGSIIVGLGNITPSSISTIGNLTFSSTAQRILGDFSNSTTANRVAFQTSTTNGNTSLEVIPNGTGFLSSINLENSSTLGNNAFMSVFSGNISVGLDSDIRGTGTQLPMHFNMGGVTKLSIETNGNVVITDNISASNLSGTNTGDQTITLTGDVTGSGTGSFAATLSDTGVTPGAYTSADVTVDSKGRITAISNGSGGGFSPAIFGPLTGQSLVYNTTSGQWENRYPAATFQIFRFSSLTTGTLDGTEFNNWSLVPQFGDGDACEIFGTSIRFLRNGRYEVRFSGSLSVTGGWPDGYTAYTLTNTGSTSVNMISSTMPFYYRYSGTGENASVNISLGANTLCDVDSTVYYEASTNGVLSLNVRAANVSSPTTLYSSVIYVKITQLDTYNPS